MKSKSKPSNGECSINGFSAARLVLVDNLGFGVELLQILPSADAAQWFCAGWNLCRQWEDPQEAKNGAAHFAKVRVVESPDEVGEPQETSEHEQSLPASSNGDATVPIFAAWTDVAPSLVHLADNEKEARSWIDAYNRNHADKPACTLADILANPKGHGVGTPIGGLET